MEEFMAQDAPAAMGRPTVAHSAAYRRVVFVLLDCATNFPHRAVV
jgi:hypothetical protein